MVIERVLGKPPTEEQTGSAMFVLRQAPEHGEKSDSKSGSSSLRLLPGEFHIADLQ
jgi:hypothetical protein